MPEIAPSQVEAVRRFNRDYTRRIGVLRPGLLDSPYSLTEVRVMYEIAHRDGIGASELASVLDLDRGYLSRILKRFASTGLLSRKATPGDARRQRLDLTAKGRRVFAPLDQRSRQQVEAMLGALDGDDRQRFVSALDSIERMLSARPAGSGPVVLRRHRPGDIGWVVQRHGELYFREYGYDERFEALVAGIAAAFVQHLDPGRERCWIAERDGERLGCIFLVAKSRTVAKLRLLLVEPGARGLGLGRRLVDECLHFAREAGYRKIVLWTQGELDAARHIYAAAGFSRTAETRHDDFGKRGLLAETWELKL
jgi:DNA-binding MarR family transcriptional regulator/N-acetylglutamate synthase-like GNAT family acetyltransferase